ncbi:outer membrane protein assembly factor BamA [Nitrospira defluvii]|nr:outer membrane protein assembly factor BamA [Nitrospira defluvii]
MPLFGSSWEGKNIGEIRLDPTSPFPEAEFYDYIDIRVGEPYQARQVRKAVERLFATGKFKALWTTVEPIELDSLRLRFHWVESRILSSIQISGNRLLTDEEIVNSMAIEMGDPYSESVWKRSLENITSRYREAGYFQTKTASQLKPPSGDRQGLDASIQIREGGRARIGKLSLRGDTIFSRGLLKLRMRSQKGEYYHAEHLKNDLRWLEEYYINKGYYKVVIGPAVVSYNEDSNEVDIAISIQPFQQVVLFFEGSQVLSKTELEKQVLIKRERSDEENVLDESLRQLERYYWREGYPNVKVGYTIEDFPEKKRRIFIFTIESGAYAKIDKIRFLGHHAFSEETLQNQIVLESSGYFKSRPYVKEDHENAVESLVQFYREEGFRNIEVTPEVQYHRSGKSVWVIFKIDEGVRTRIDQIEIKGNASISDDHLKEALTLEFQIPYTDTRVQEGARALLSAYARQGYLYADMRPELNFSFEQTEVTVTYHVMEGKQVRVGKITLEGNLRTKPDVIIKRLAIHTGDPYDPEKVLESQKEIYRTSLFSSVRFEPLELEKKGDVQDIRLQLVERPRISLEFGVGYSDREALRGIIEVVHRNLWGTNQMISARAEGSRLEERYFLSYKKPWFFHKTVTARASLASLDLEEVSFDEQTFSAVVGVDKKFTKTIQGSLLYQYERKEASNVSNPNDFKPEDIGVLKIGTLNPSLIRDTRDNVLYPTSGSVNSILFRDAAKILGSEVQLVKLILQSRWYRKITTHSVFALSMGAGVVERFGDSQSIHISERFFLGGRNTVRGYDQDKLGIDGVTINTPPPPAASQPHKVGEPTGGNAMLVLNEELRIQLPKSFGLVIFFDHGNIWDDPRNFDASDIKSSVGAGLRYNTPIGPFRLDWGYKLNREDYEDPWAIHFTLGHAF